MINKITIALAFFLLAAACSPQVIQTGSGAPTETPTNVVSAPALPSVTSPPTAPLPTPTRFSPSRLETPLPEGTAASITRENAAQLRRIGQYYRMDAMILDGEGAMMYRWYLDKADLFDLRASKLLRHFPVSPALISVGGRYSLSLEENRYIIRSNLDGSIVMSTPWDQFSYYPSGLSPEGDYLAVKFPGDTPGAFTTSVIRTSNQEVVFNSNEYFASFSPAGRYLLTWLTTRTDDGATRSTYRLYTTLDWTKTTEFNLSITQDAKIMFSWDDTMLAHARGRRVDIYRLPDRRLVSSISLPPQPGGSDPIQIKFSADNLKIAIL
ncbi:MAG: hypothetical protein U1B80_02925, partial [Anaerolineaceae bacterium]|nr:hypothetical protein [Anaerolineaceae bacterium]